MNDKDNKRVVVIGSGISGLVFGFYNPESIVVAGKVERKEDPLTFIQVNKYTKQLMKDIGFDSLGVTEVSIQFDSSKNDIIKSKVERADYFYTGTDRIANVGKDSKLIVFYISVKFLCDYIEEKIELENPNRIIKEDVDFIDSSIVLLSDGRAIEYSKIISTINCVSFEKIYTGWKCGDVKIGDMKIGIENYDGAGNSITYRDGDYSKIVNNSMCGNTVFEFNNNAEIDHSLDDDIITIKNSRFDGILNPPPENIIFLGRFATANKHWRIEDSIFIAKYGLCLQEMMDEQRRYDKFIKDNVKVTGEERTNKLILHMHSELSELLRETNWKMNDKEKRIVKSTSVLEECIDIMKLLYAILGEFNYTTREICDMFDSKSEKCWDKTLDNFFGGV